MTRAVLVDGLTAAVEAAFLCAGGAIIGYVLYGDPSRIGIGYVFVVVFSLSFRRLRLASTVGQTVISIRRILTTPTR